MGPIVKQSLVVFCAALFSAQAACATVITFDTAKSGTVIGSLYANKGVLFSGATIEDLAGTGIATSTPPNAAVNEDSGSMSFSFTGRLPDEVSFTISTAAQDSVEAVALAADGMEDIVRTSGAAGPFSTPYVPNDLVSFSLPNIERITLYDFFDLRGDIALDTLRFGATAVPEPSSWLLLVAPAIGLAAACRQRARARRV